jgi:hypothetical protein
MPQGADSSSFSPATLERMLRRRECGHGWRIATALLAEMIGAMITPILLVIVLTLLLFYMVIFIIISAPHDVYKIGISLAAAILVFYLLLFVISLRREWRIRRHFLALSEKRPPPDFPPAGAHGPPFYVSLTPDFYDDDVPPPWLLRLPSFWASMLVKDFLQWRVYRSVRGVDRKRAAQIVRKLSTDRRTPLIEDLCNQGESPASIFLPLCYLLAMDVISINSDWTKAWLNDHVRVPPPRRAAAVKLFPPPGRRKSGPV